MVRNSSKSMEIKYFGMDCTIEHFHGNWKGEIPHVHRWAYDYSKPGHKEDFMPQHIPLQREKRTTTLVYKDKNVSVLNLGCFFIKPFHKTV